MGGLILKLRPYEELMINGVLVENGDRNTRLRVKTGGAHILRLRDALKPDELTTPSKKAYYIAQLAVSGQISEAEAAEILGKAVHELPPMPDGEDIAALIAKRDFYSVMRALKDLALDGRPGVALTDS